MSKMSKYDENIYKYVVTNMNNQTRKKEK